MTTKQLLSANSYIQYPRFLGNFIGVNEAVLLSAFCDKDSWCDFNMENYDGWFYYLRDEIKIETGLTESQQRTALKTLTDLCIINTKRAGIPAKVYYKIDINELESVLNDAYNTYKAHKSQWSQNMTTSGAENMTTSDIENRISTIDKNINIKINNKSTGAGAHSKNHSKVYKQRNTLEDTLESGKDIDEQKKASKKSPAEKLRDECYDIIDDVYSEHDYSYTVHDLLVEYFEFVSAVPEDKDNLCKRVKTAKAWKHKLDRLNELVKDGYDPRDIIQQSLDKKQYVFYPLQKSESSSRIKEGNQQNVKVSDPEWARKVIQDAIDNGEEFY